MRLHLTALEMFGFFATLSALAPAYTPHAGDALIVTFLGMSLSLGGVLATLLHRPRTHITLLK
jgi:hypothetical protein